MAECSFMNQVALGSSAVAVAYISDFAPASSKEFLDIQVTIDSGYTLNCLRDKIRTYSQMHVLISTHNAAQSLFQFS